MAPTRTDATRLTAIAALLRAGLSPAQVRAQLGISRRHWFRIVPEIGEIRTRATALLSAQ